MKRTLAPCLLALAASVAALGLAGAPAVPPPPAARDANGPDRPASAAGGALAPAGAIAAAAPSERRPAPPAPAAEAAPRSDLTFVLTGAPPHELSGTATVRYADDTQREVPFPAGRFVAAERETVRGVALRVPGFATAWPKLGTDRPSLEVPMQRAGAIRVRLTDSSGTPLQDRCVWCLCQRSDVPGAGDWGNYQGNARAVTDAAGIATLAGLLPGRYDLGTASLGEWDAGRAEAITVTAGGVAIQDLVAPVLAPEQFGGFELTAAAAGPVARGPLGDITNFVFATAPESHYPLHQLGQRVRCIARGRQGEQLTGRIVALQDGQPRPDLRRSAPIAITIGAVFAWQPVWER